MSVLGGGHFTDEAYARMGDEVKAATARAKARLHIESALGRTSVVVAHTDADRARMRHLRDDLLAALAALDDEP